MSWSDVGTIAPIVIAVLVAMAILVVDMDVPGRRSPILVTALGGLAVVAAAMDPARDPDFPAGVVGAQLVEVVQTVSTHAV